MGIGAKQGETEGFSRITGEWEGLKAGGQVIVSLRPELHRVSPQSALGPHNVKPTVSQGQDSFGGLKMGRLHARVQAYVLQIGPGLKSEELGWAGVGDTTGAVWI